FSQGIEVGVPFANTEPALKMFTGTAPNIGSVNGIGTDFLFQSQTANNFAFPSALPPSIATTPFVATTTAPTLTTTPSQTSPPAACDDTYYPNATSDPLTNVDFNESDVLAGVSPSDGTTISMANGRLQVFYNDEHALALGVSQVTVKTSGGTTTTNYP